MATTESSSSLSPWYAIYPAPKNPNPGTILREELLDLMKQANSTADKDYLLVDLRRNDHEGGTIRGSINLPAQSLYPTIPTLYTLLKAAGLRKIIWYCSSSRGRGNRAAGWFSDYVTDKGDDDMVSLVLVEGIKGWANAGAEYVQWVDEYDEKFWLNN